MNSLTVASGAVLQPVVGLLLDLLAEAGPASYTAASYRLAFLAILVTALAGLLVAFRLREKGLKPVHFSVSSVMLPAVSAKGEY